MYRFRVVTISKRAFRLHAWGLRLVGRVRVVLGRFAPSDSPGGAIWVGVPPTCLGSAFDRHRPCRPPFCLPTIQKPPLRGLPGWGYLGRRSAYMLGVHKSM